MIILGLVSSMNRESSSPCSQLFTTQFSAGLSRETPWLATANHLGTTIDESNLKCLNPVTNHGCNDINNGISSLPGPSVLLILESSNGSCVPGWWLIVEVPPLMFGYEDWFCIRLYHWVCPFKIQVVQENLYRRMMAWNYTGSELIEQTAHIPRMEHRYMSMDS